MSESAIASPIASMTAMLALGCQAERTGLFDCTHVEDQVGKRPAAPNRGGKSRQSRWRRPGAGPFPAVPAPRGSCHWSRKRPPRRHGRPAPGRRGPLRPGGRNPRASPSSTGVAANLRAIWPALPMPVVNTLPEQAARHSTARTNSSVDRNRHDGFGFRLEYRAHALAYVHARFFNRGGGMVS